MKFLHVLGPDTKNSYGILSQLHKHCDPQEHEFLIAAYASCKSRFPKLNEFPELSFIPERGGRLSRILYFYRKLSKADVIIWHSLYFTTKKYLLFLWLFPRFPRKSVWVEWGADLYLWKYSDSTWKGRLLNRIGKKIRDNMKYVGCCFPVDDVEVHRQFGDDKKCFFTPLANPKKEATGLIDEVLALKPEAPRKDPRVNVQIAHNSFTFNNHIRIIDHLSHFRDKDMFYILPVSYGVYGINGQYGGTAYRNAVIQYARKELGKENVGVILENIPFDRYIRFLWNVDIAVFDFDRPCGLGTLRIMLLMGKKIFIPAGTPYYNFLTAQGLPIYDTNRIPEMSYEEFIAPPEYTTKDWVLSYMNNDDIIRHWLDMFEEIKSEKRG